MTHMLDTGWSNYGCLWQTNTTTAVVELFVVCLLVVCAFVAEVDVDFATNSTTNFSQYRSKTH